MSTAAARGRPIDSDDDDDNNKNDDDQWGGWEAEQDEGEPAACLFCVAAAGGSPLMLESAELALKHMAAEHSFDLLAVQREQKLTQYEVIQLINYLRTQAKSNPGVVPTTVPQREAFVKDEFYQPVLQNDALLTYDYEGDFVEEEPVAVSDAELDPRTLKYVESLRQEIEQMRSSFAAFRAETAAALLGDDDKDAAAKRDGDGHNSDSGSSDSEVDEDADVEGYFRSYGHYGIHEEMIKDAVRTDSYRDFMYKNPALFKDKVVLDVGCGTGILSMFAAKAGARMVIGVDNSSVAEIAKANVKENGLDNIVTILRGKVEEVKLPVDKVDIIVSEWMGYFLLFESMLDTVLYARDRWLAPGGVVHPDKSSMYLAAMGEGEYNHHVRFWENVYEFKMTKMRDTVLREADVCIVAQDDIISPPYVMKSLDMHTVKLEDLQFTTPFTLGINQKRSMAAICSYFDIVFEQGCSDVVYFSTGPEATPTHWKQTVFYVQPPIAVSPGDIVSGELVCRRQKVNTRALIVTLSFSVTFASGADSVSYKAKYLI